MRRLRVVVATKSGGHAIEAKGAMRRFAGAELVVVTSPDDHQEYGVRRYHVPPFRRTASRRLYPLRLLRNALGSLRVLWSERPDIVVCCGANNSLPLGALARLSGRRVIAIEATNRISRPSKAPRLLARLGAEVWIAHEGLRGRYAGRSVLVGMTHPYADDLASFRSAERDIPLTIVPSSADRLEAEGVVTGLSHEELLAVMGRSRTVVTRGGLAAWEAAHLADEVVIVPLETADASHQAEFAGWLVDRFANTRRETSLERYLNESAAPAPGHAARADAVR